MEETFDFLPLHLDPATKAVTAPSSSSRALAEELAILNSTHRAFLNLETPHTVPPPPLPLNPKRSVAVQKLREQGNAALSRRANGPTPIHHIQEAAKLYTLALQAALERPAWEPASIVRDEVAILMSNRSQAHIGLQMWPEASVDAETSLELKGAPGQGKAWWRKVRSLMEMGRWEEASSWAERGMSIDGGDGLNELKQLHVEIQAVMRQKESARERREKA